MRDVSFGPTSCCLWLPHALNGGIGRFVPHSALYRPHRKVGCHRFACGHAMVPAVRRKICLLHACVHSHPLVKSRKHDVIENQTIPAERSGSVVCNDHHQSPFKICSYSLPRIHIWPRCLCLHSHTCNIAVLHCPGTILDETGCTFLRFCGPKWAKNTTTATTSLTPKRSYFFTFVTMMKKAFAILCICLAVAGVQAGTFVSSTLISS